MSNKKLILIGTIITVAALAIVSLFSYKNYSAPSGGAKSLTRDKAQQIIWENVKKIKKTVGTLYFKGISIGNYPAGHTWQFDDTKLQEAEKRGLVKIKGRSAGGSTLFDFTDKAQLYLSPSKNSFDRQDKSRDILLAEPTSIEVTGLTAPAENGGKKTITAEFTVKYELTPFGEAILNSATEQSKAIFQLYDDGWRLEGVGLF